MDFALSPDRWQMGSCPDEASWTPDDYTFSFSIPNVFFHIGLDLFFERIHLHKRSSLRLSGSLPCCTNKHQSQFLLSMPQPDTNIHVIGASPAGYLPKHSFGRLWCSKWLVGFEPLQTDSFVLFFKKRSDCSSAGVNLNNSLLSIYQLHWLHLLFSTRSRFCPWSRLQSMAWWETEQQQSHTCGQEEEEQKCEGCVWQTKTGTGRDLLQKSGSLDPEKKKNPVLDRAVS